MANPGFEYLSARQSQIDHAVLAGRARGSGGDVVLSAAERAVHTYVCGVSGSGKSRFLQNLLFQDIGKGHAVALIDPMGDLYRSVLEYVATGLEQASQQGFQRRDLLPRYLFLDASDRENPLRLNPLEASPHESSEQQVDDLMRALERLFEGKLEEQRRLRNVLRATFMLIAELNRLPPADRPSLHALDTGSGYPLTLFAAPEILNLPPPERQKLLDTLPPAPRLHYYRQYWQNLADNAQERGRIVQSSWNVLQYLLADDLVLRVFGTERSTFDLGAVLREGLSLFCFLPKNENLAGARFLGKYLTTKLQHAAYRRPEAEWSQSYYLYLDEFHQFVDQAFADALTNLRKFGLRLTNAHQSKTQPPFDTRQGQALLRTIRANSRVKVLFRLERPDAEELSKELFALTQRRENFLSTDRSISHSRQRSTRTGTSSTRSDQSGRNWSDGHSFSYDDERSDSFREGTAQSVQSGSSRGESSSLEHSTGRTETATRRTVYHTLDGERELLINSLQRLSDRECYVATAALRAQLVETPFVPDSHYAYLTEDLPARLLELQRERLEEKEEQEKPEVRLLPQAPAAPQVPETQPDVAPTVVWPPEEVVVREERAKEPVEARKPEPVVELGEEDPFLD